MFKGLLFKLLVIKVPIQLVSIIHYFLEGRSFRVKNGDLNLHSEKYKHGSCLSSHLFSVCVNGLKSKNSLVCGQHNILLTKCKELYCSQESSITGWPIYFVVS